VALAFVIAAAHLMSPSSGSSRKREQGFTCGSEAWRGT
jgi:hypothetical protein